jgi:uncharacterized membrane protein YbhN (UPF0104 family)
LLSVQQPSRQERVTEQRIETPGSEWVARVIASGRRFAQFIDNRVGWGRIGFVLSVIIIVVAARALYDILYQIDLRKVIVALRSFEWYDIALAATFVAGAYYTLIFYDVFALRTIGHNEVPFRIAALGGFTSYSIGHNVGASAFTGGAVRYRVYSFWGLDAIDVAKLCFIAGLTFWLGNATVLGLGVGYAPHAVTQILGTPEWLNRSLAVLTLVVLAGYVAWVWTRPRVIGFHGLHIPLPKGPLTTLQIVIGIVDLTCCALAMYMLVPDQPHVGFITVAVIFVSATLLGFASHSPGGLGVFDAAMLVALSQYDKEQLLAGLLIFRLLYYIIPFVAALTIHGVRELMLAFERTRTRRPDSRSQVD